jgi:hypothetical protein
MFTAMPSIASSSYASHTALPVLAVIAAPVAMFLPQMNA